MGFRNYNINILIRLVFIVFTAIWLGVEFPANQKVYTKMFCVLLIIIQVIALFFYLNKMNRELIRFLKILNINDSAYRFTSDLHGNFSELAKLLNNTADIVIEGRIEKEKQYQFLQFVIEQINIGLIAFNEQGNIEFINSAFRNQLKINAIQTINDLKEINTELVKKLQTNNPSLSFQTKLLIENQPVQMFVQKKQIKINNELINLVSVQNITAELDKKELESWQKLIRVLTHEIMNSITPITNLTYSIQRSLKEDKDLLIDQNISIKEALEDVETIENRSKSLLQFVDNYRKLTRVGKLNVQKSNIAELIRNAVSVFKEDFNISNVKCTLSLDDTIHSEVDDKLLEQAIINLLKNSLEAFPVEHKDAQIEIHLLKEKADIIISVSDNGKGIEDDKLDDIFIPFYTSKEKGTGIGLSFVKQIISLHNGTITVNSITKKKQTGRKGGTTFQIKL